MDEHHEADRYLSPREAAAYQKMSLSWIRKKTASGEIPHIKLGRRVVYDRLDLDEFLRQKKVETAWRQRDDQRRA